MLLISFASPSAFAVPLTDELVKKASSILLVRGSFDPVTNIHLQNARQALQQTDGRLVIFLPTGEAIHSQTLPFDARIELTNVALAAEPQIATPSEGLWKDLASRDRILDKSFYAHLRELNPKANLSLIESDEASNLSSSKAKDLLKKNLDLYLGDPKDSHLQSLRSELTSYLPSSVAGQILERGLYIGSRTESKITAFDLLKIWTKKSLTGALIKAGFYDQFKKTVVSFKKKDKLTEVSLNGKTYPLKKYLGSGMSADAYLITLDGQDMVIKIARTESARASILESVPVHLWAQNKFNVKSPALIDYDSEGKWMITEFVKGQSVKSYLEEHGSLTLEIKNSILEMHAQMRALSEVSLIGMDFAADNLIIRDGVVYLVDMGPIPRDGRLMEDGNAQIESWQKSFSQAQPSKVRVTAPLCNSIY